MAPPTTLARITRCCLLLFLSACHAQLSEHDALDTIHALPEVQAFARQLANSNHDAKLIMRREEASGKQDDALFHFYIGESLPDHTVLWQRLAIDKRTGAIFVDDPLATTPVPLEQWRKEQH